MHGKRCKVNDMNGKIKKISKPKDFNPWPVCHPNCCACTSLWDDYDTAETEASDIEEDIKTQLEDLADYKKDMVKAMAKLKAHVKTKEHAENIKEHDC